MEKQENPKYKLYKCYQTVYVTKLLQLCKLTTFELSVPSAWKQSLVKISNNEPRYSPKTQGRAVPAGALDAEEYTHTTQIKEFILRL